MCLGSGLEWVGITIKSAAFAEQLVNFAIFQMSGIGKNEVAATEWS